MQRDVLHLEEMIEAAEQIGVLTGDLPAVADLEADRLRRDALAVELHSARRGCQSALRSRA